MAEHDELRGTTLGGAIGCLTAFIAGTPTFLAAMLWAFYGDCLDSVECHQGEWLRFLAVVVVTLAVALPVGLVSRQLANWMARRNR